MKRNSIRISKRLLSTSSWPLMLYATLVGRYVIASRILEVQQSLVPHTIKSAWPLIRYMYHLQAFEPSINSTSANLFFVWLLYIKELLGGPWRAKKAKNERHEIVFFLFLPTERPTRFPSLPASQRHQPAPQTVSSHFRRSHRAVLHVHLAIHSRWNRCMSQSVWRG